MTDQITTTAPATQAAIAALTPAGKEFMLLVGQRKFDFFDEGIVEHSGNWGEHMAWQAAGKMGKTRRSMGGIMARLGSDELGLWYVNEDDGQMWWSLTALGADVANTLAAQAN